MGKLSRFARSEIGPIEMEIGTAWFSRYRKMSESWNLMPEITHNLRSRRMRISERGVSWTFFSLFKSCKSWRHGLVLSYLMNCCLLRIACSWASHYFYAIGNGAWSDSFSRKCCGYLLILQGEWNYLIKSHSEKGPLNNTLDKKLIKPLQLKGKKEKMTKYLQGGPP